jgi:hypothetical protein
MSEGRAELAHRLNDALNRRDIDYMLSFADPDIEFTPRLARLEGGGPLRGHDGFRSWWDSWLAVLPDFHSEVEEVQDFGDISLARTRLRGYGTASGATIEQTVWHVTEWRDKQCIRWLVFTNRQEALEAAGLQE